MQQNKFINRAVAMAAAGSVWPGLSPGTAREFTRIGRGLPIQSINTFYQKHERYYHVLDYLVTGHNTLTFFNEKAVDGITNLQNGEVPTERPFWLTGVCVTFQDLTAAGARSGAQLSSTATTSIDRAEQVRSIIHAGLLKLNVGDRPVLDTQDLTHFPSDGGMYVQASFASFAAATNSSMCPYTNGVPIAGNRFKLPQPYPVLPGKRISCVLNWQQALSITTAGRIKVELVGESVIPLNT